MWLWYQLQTHVRAALMFSESQSVYHVNVTGDWKLVELGCMLLSVKFLLGAVMCLCVCVCACTTACIHRHSYVHTVQACLCMVARSWITYPLPNYLRFQGSCLPPGLPTGCHSMHEQRKQRVYYYSKPHIGTRRHSLRSWLWICSYSDGIVGGKAQKKQKSKKRQTLKP